MATLVEAPPALSNDLALFHTTDPFLANAPLLLFHGPAATVGATSSRIQLHIFTIAGHASYSRLAVSPNSPFYTAVSNLPREEQGDEICRSIAFGLRKYFEELSQVVKDALCTQSKTSSKMLFGDNHVAVLASRLKRVENAKAVAEDVIRCFAEQKISWLDVDVVLPPGTIKELPKRGDSAASDDFDERKLMAHQYGRYSEIVASFGQSTFLPTSRMKRAPSKVSSIGRTASFMRQQRENARKEVSELVLTELNYLSRIQELQSLRDSTSGMNDKSAALFKGVFPSSLDTIAKVNAGLYEQLQEILARTDETSREELESMTLEQPSAQQIRQDLLVDNQGIGAIAKCLCEELPLLEDCYNSYIQDHVAATLLLRNLIRGTDEAVLTTIQEIGEQRLTSLLIEPVQRLPRYVLYIDSISKQLPTRHPALKQLLRAKDIITNICEQSGSGANLTLSEKLLASVKTWPVDLELRGRLITAVDYVELRPPFSIDHVVQQGILVLSTDGVTILSKPDDQSISARTLLTELEAPSLRRTIATDLSFVKHVSLDDVECAESHEGQSIQFLNDALISTFLLEGQYENKAVRLLEEITKARIEARFSEAERESTSWEVRATDPKPEQVQLLSAIFENTNNEHVAARRGKAAVRVLVDIDKHSHKPRAGRDGLHTVVAISLLRDGCKLSIDTVEGTGGSEQILMNELSSLLRRKLSVILGVRSGRPALAKTLVERHRDMLLSMDLQLATAINVMAPAPMAKPRQPLRPLSPVKMLSNFLSSQSENRSTLKKEPSGSSIMSAATTFSMLPASRSNTSITKPVSREGLTSKDQARPKSSASMQSFANESDTTKRLEETLSAYLLALKARKGNIVGRSLKMRANADELAINELYNVLLGNHQMMVSAAQATVDILFAAFEKFLHVAWRDRIGPVMPISVLQDIQSKAEKALPADFDECCRAAIRSLSSPNQRAFKGIISLLNDLLDGTGNDADRGALTAAFAELLITEDNPYDYVSLVDRFVDDVDTYFGETMPEQVEDPSTAHKRSRSVNTGSVTSNTSSLRRKFGLGSLSRGNSKSETEKESVWRSLSKSRNQEHSPADSLSRSASQRARSTESEHRQSRPVSQDGKKTNDSLQIPIILPSILPGLTTIGEHPSFIPTGPPRKKRRSSLSDLKMLDTPFVTPQRIQSPPTRNQSVDQTSPSTPSSKGNSLRIPSPVRISQRPPIPASFRQDISNETLPADPALRTSVHPYAGTTSLLHHDQMAIQAHNQSTLSRKLTQNTPIIQNTSSMLRQAQSTPVSPPRLRQASNIPALSPRSSSPSKVLPITPIRSGLQERHDAGNIIRKPSTIEKTLEVNPITGSPSKKIRIQSPQKMRERLQNEQTAIVTAHSNLQDELSKIGEELALTPSRLIPNRGSLHKSQGSTSIELTAKVLKMEGVLSEQMARLTSQIDSIQNDVKSSLSVSENKCRKLDELYRESNSENEALYARFNAELAKVSRAVRGGDGVEELKRRLKEQEDEIARLRKENVRLKREALGLRAQLKE